MSRILVVSPHPDDETFGCGGTLLRHRAAGDELGWLIFTEPHAAFTNPHRDEEIQEVARRYGFASTTRLGFTAAELDGIPLSRLIEKVAPALKAFQPEEMYLPFPGDAHSDHRMVFEACMACSKWFRYPFLRRVVCYETLSETNFGARPTESRFAPTSWVDISDHLEEKIAIMKVYASELGDHPFPRSEASVRAQALLRGTEAGAKSAEAFQLIRERR